MSAQNTKVVIAGASGETGMSIINELLKKPDEFTVTALVRPSSIEKPKVQGIKKRGANVVGIDLETPLEEMTTCLAGQDVVISCVIPFAADLEKKLADAAKAARIKRFVPSFFGPACPPTGVSILRETKEQVLNHIKKIHLPYTVIDVGWWYQGSLPRLPSARLDYMVRFPVTHIIGDGNHPSALTDLRDVGQYVARIIKDARTINRYVFVHNEVRTQEEIFNLLERASGEEIAREYVSKDQAEAAIEDAAQKYADDPSPAAYLTLAVQQYANMVWLRGDNLPETAAYLGYLDGKTLYPDLRFTTLETFIQDGIDGKGEMTYKDRVFPMEK